MVAADADCAAAKGPTSAPHTNKGNNARATNDVPTRRLFESDTLGCTI